MLLSSDRTVLLRRKLQRLSDTGWPRRSRSATTDAEHSGAAPETHACQNGPPNDRVARERTAVLRLPRTPPAPRPHAPCCPRFQAAPASLDLRYQCAAAADGLSP